MEKGTSSSSESANVSIPRLLTDKKQLITVDKHTINPSFHQKKYRSIQKEALVIVEDIRQWSHLLSRRQFTLAGDQRLVTSMFDARKHSKIKNVKNYELATCFSSVVFQDIVQAFFSAQQ